MSSLRARKVAPGDFEAFDLILAMDANNYAELEAIRPAGNETPLRLFRSFAPGPETEVDDPYYTDRYAETLDVIEAATDGLLDQLQNASAV